MKILNHTQIRQKIKRLAFEIAEDNYNVDSVILAGINNNGMRFAGLLLDELEQIGELDVHLSRIMLSPAKPTERPVEIDMDLSEIQGKTVIIADDVANTGRTLFYACLPLMGVVPRKIQCAVLVDRKHKAFPVHVDYVGLSLATTLKENIDVELEDPEDMAVFLV